MLWGNALIEFPTITAFCLKQKKPNLGMIGNKHDNDDDRWWSIHAKINRWGYAKSLNNSPHFWGVETAWTSSNVSRLKQLLLSSPKASTEHQLQNNCYTQYKTTNLTTRAWHQYYGTGQPSVKEGDINGRALSSRSREESLTHSERHLCLAARLMEGRNWWNIYLHKLRRSFETLPYYLSCT